LCATSNYFDDLIFLVLFAGAILWKVETDLTDTEKAVGKWLKDAPWRSQDSPVKSTKKVTTKSPNKMSSKSSKKVCAKSPVKVSAESPKEVAAKSAKKVSAKS